MTIPQVRAFPPARPIATEAAPQPEIAVTRRATNGGERTDPGPRSALAPTQSTAARNQAGPEPGDPFAESANLRAAPARLPRPGPVSQGPHASPSPQRENDLPAIQNVEPLTSLSRLKAFKALPVADKLSQSIEFTSDRNGQYQYYLDRQDGGIRLNIVGHGDKGGMTFKADLPGGNFHSPEGFADLIAPLIARSGAASLRLVSCRSAATGFAARLADRLNMPVTAPMGTVIAFEVMKDRYWILEKPFNPRSPTNHEWKTFMPRA